MGLFDFLKKISSTPSMKPKCFQVDFVNQNGISLGKSEIIFGKSEPGAFQLNGTTYSLQNDYVDDIGPSSDLKYKRVATKNFCFWISPPEFDSFIHYMNQAAQEAISKDVPKIDFVTYLGKGRTFFSEAMGFNIVGVSHNFGYNTAKIISSLSVGSKLLLKLASDDLDSPDCIKVTTQSGQQLGWFPYDSESFLNQELLNQLKAGVIKVATVENKGQVTDKPYWWCAASFTLQIPYNMSDPIVYIAPSGYLYHTSSTCQKTASLKIPKWYAEKCGRSLCSKCEKRGQA